MAFTSLRFRGNARLEAAASNSPPMKFGESGPDVAIVQQALLDLEYPFFDSIRDDGYMDGIFGPETREVVKEFQRSYPNPVDDDGIIGHDTMEKLDKAIVAGTTVRPKGNEKLKRLVTNALAGHEVVRLSVNRLGFHLNSHALALVAGAVIDDLIDVRHDTTKPSGEAEYDSHDDVFKFGFDNAATPTRKALIIHEAVHAAMDMQATAGLIKCQSEAIAYVAQCYYMYMHTADPKAERLVATTTGPSDDDVYRLAWRIADKLHDGKRVEELDWHALENSFYYHSEYASDAGTRCQFNGLKRAI